MDRGVFREIDLAVGAAAPIPLLMRKTGRELCGRQASEALIQTAAGTACEEIAPIDDLRASAWYRRRMCRSLVRNLLGRIVQT